MNLLNMENPVFVVYVIAAAIMVLKMMLQGWMTVYRMLKSNSGFASKEDLRKGMINKNPSPEQLEVNDYVDRSRRMHRNDLENIPAFLIAGLLFVVVDPRPYGLRRRLCTGLCWRDWRTSPPMPQRRATRSVPRFTASAHSS